MSDDFKNNESAPPAMFKLIPFLAQQCAVSMERIGRLEIVLTDSAILEAHE